MDLLIHLLKRDRPRQCIVFTRTKRGADRLADRLRRTIQGVAAIHGDLPQSTRDRVMRGFRSGRSACWSPPTSSAAASTSRTSAT